MMTEVIQSSGPDGRRIDVELGGYVLPLDGLRKALRKMKVTQPYLAERTNLHQSTVSNHLRGTPMSPDLLAAIEECFEAAEDMDLSMVEGAYHPQAGEVRQIEVSPSNWNETIQQLSSQERKGSPELHKAFDHLMNRSGVPEPFLSGGKTLSPFPMEDAHKLALRVRKDFEQGGVVRQSFSMRKLKLWGEAFYLLQADGFSVDEALAGAYHAAAVGKTLPKSEEREFLTAQFDIFFGFEPALPKANGNTARADGNRHPMDYVAEPLIRAGIPVWLTGASATGKTWSAKDLSRRTAGGFIRMQGTHDTHEDDFVGGMAAQDASTYFQHGPLPLAMQDGLKLVIDELSFVPSGALSALQAVLEGEDLVIKANAGEHVPPQPGFSIIVTDNTRGLGEGLSYVGTEVVNESIRDRFLFLEWDFMPPSQEKLAVSTHLNDLMTRNRWRMKG